MADRQARSGGSPKTPPEVVSNYLPECARCGHPADWHRLDDALNLDPTDPATPFRCIAEVFGTPCVCEDYEMPKGAGPTDADIARGEQLAQEHGWD